MARKPRKIPITTLRAVAAAHALGFTHWGQAQGTIDWAVADDGLAHAIRRRTTRGNSQAAHICRTFRDQLAEKMKAYGPLAREYTNLELTAVHPVWLCDVDGEFVDCPPTDDIMAISGLDLSVEVDS